MAMLWQALEALELLGRKRQTTTRPHRWRKGAPGASSWEGTGTLPSPPPEVVNSSVALR